MRARTFTLIPFLVACGASQPVASDSDGERLAPENLYPLAEGDVWSHELDLGEDQPPHLSITRVVAVHGQRFEVSTDRSTPVVYEVREEGIFRPGYGVWLLKAPVQEGATWPSTSGRVARVTSTEASVTTPAGTFERCVRVEEGGAPDKQQAITVYCAGVGPVYIESRIHPGGVATEEARVVARLRGHALAGEATP